MKNHYQFPLRSWIAATLFLLCTFVVPVHAADRYAVASGFWNSTSTWAASSGGASGASVPVAGDAVYISEGATAYVIAIPAGYNAACANLYMGSASAVNATLTFSAATATLTVSGNVILYGPNNACNRYLNVNAGVLTVNGNLELGNGQTGNQANRTCHVVLTTGTATVNGNLVYNNISGSSPAQTYLDLSGGACTFNLGGSFTVNNSSGTVAPGTSSTFNYMGANQTVTYVSNVAYNHVVFSGSGNKTFSVATTIGGTLEIKSGVKADLGTALSHSTGYLKFGGQYQQSGTWGSTGSSASNQNDTYFVAASSGVLTVSSSAYFSNGSNAPNLTTSWTTARDGSGTNPANFTSGNIFIVQNGHTMTTTAAWSVSGTGSRVVIENGGTLVAASTFAITLASATTFQIDGGGLYKHQHNTAYGTTIFAGVEAFDKDATVELNNSNTTGPSGVDFGNLTVNFTVDPGGSVNLAGAITSIRGNFTVQSTSTREFRLTGNTTFTLNIGGNVSVTGGTLNCSSGTGVATVNVKGNFSHTGGTITETSTGNAVFNFTGNSTQTYTSGGTVSNMINFAVANGAILDLGASNVLGDGSSGTFTLASGGTLITGHSGGITSSGATGCIRVSGTRSYNTAANYEYSGTGAQATGNGLPATIGNFTLSNTGGTCTATYGFTVSGTFTTATGSVIDMVTNALGVSTVAHSGTLKTQNTGSTPITSGKTWGGTVDYNTSFGSQTVVGGTYNHLTLSNSSGTSTAGAALTVNGTLTTTAGGTLDLSTYTLDGTLSGITNGGTIKTASTDATPVPSGKTWGGLFEYNGGTQTVVEGTYNNLTISTSGSKTLTGAATVGGNLNITTGPLTIGDAGELTVSGTTALSGTNCMVIESTSAGTGSFIDNGFSGTGTVKVKRHLTPYSVITDRKYHLLSSPVTAQAIRPEFVSNTNPIPGNDDFYKFDETTYNWINTRDNSGNWNTSFENDFVVGRGYLVAYASEATKEFTGSLNTYSSGTPLTLTCTWTSFSSGGGSEGWNLLGNPFPSAVDWSLVTLGNGMDNALYYYDAALQNYRYYIQVSGVPVGLGSAQQYIPAMQGFMVHAKQTGTKTVTLDNTMRTHNGQDVYYKEAAAINNLLNLKVTGNNFEDEAFVYFINGATDNFDGDFDAYKLLSFNNLVPQIYTVTPGNSDLAINALPLPQGVPADVPLSFIAGADGSYSIQASNLSSFSPNAVILLEDKKAGQTQNLIQNPNYTFSATTTDSHDRFILHFSGPISINDQPVDNGIKAYASGKTLTVANLESAKTNRITVYNLLGQQLTSRTVTGTPVATLDMSGFSGYAIVKISTDDEVHAVKVLIR